MPGRNPFAPVNECLVNHPGISQYFFELILFCKTVPGVGGTDLAGVFKDKELKARG